MVNLLKRFLILAQSILLALSGANVYAQNDDKDPKYAETEALAQQYHALIAISPKVTGTELLKVGVADDLTGIDIDYLFTNDDFIPKVLDFKSIANIQRNAIISKLCQSDQVKHKFRAFVRGGHYLRYNFFDGAKNLISSVKIDEELCTINAKDDNKTPLIKVNEMKKLLKLYKGEIDFLYTQDDLSPAIVTITEDKLGLELIFLYTGSIAPSAIEALHNKVESRLLNVFCNTKTTENNQGHMRFISNDHYLNYSIYDMYNTPLMHVLIDSNFCTIHEEKVKDLIKNEQNLNKAKGKGKGRG